LGSAEQRSDIFAVGVLLWELLTYRRFSQDRTQQEVVQARMTGVDPELMRQALGVPVELLQICTRAAAKRVEDRYSSAAEMRDALRAYIRANNLECSAVQMRAVIGDLYAEERAEIRRLVDQRMKQAVLEDNQPGSVVQPIPVAPAVLGGGTATLTANAATFMPPRPASARLKWFASVAAVAGLATIGARWLSKSDGTPPVAASSSSASGLGTLAAGTTATGAAPKLVTLKIAATPADTEILLDGARLEGNPFTGQFPQNMALHRLELRSAGRVTEARMVRLDQDLDLLIALPMDKVPSTRARSVAAGAGLPFAPLNEGPSASKPPSSRGPDAAPSTVSPGDAVALPRRERSAPARPIDDTDPYAK